MNFNLQQFYFSAQGRVNRKQWWLRLILPIFVITLVLAFIDMVTGAYEPKVGVGILSGLFALACLIPAILVDINLAGTPGANRFGPPPNGRMITEASPT